VSTKGGAQVRWRKDGKEIKRVEPERPVPLFTTRVRGGPVQTSGSHEYAVSPDGQRFLVNTLIGDEAVTSPITLVLNWQLKP
jgi:hypothetical protein